MRHVFARSGKRILLEKRAHKRKESLGCRLPWHRLGVVRIYRKYLQEVADCSLLDCQSAIHIGFAQMHKEVKHQLREQFLVMYFYRYVRTILARTKIERLAIRANDAEAPPTDKSG